MSFAPCIILVDSSIIYPSFGPAALPPPSVVAPRCPRQKGMLTNNAQSVAAILQLLSNIAATRTAAALPRERVQLSKCPCLPRLSVFTPTRDITQRSFQLPKVSKTILYTIH